MTEPIITYDDITNKKNILTSILYDNLPTKYHKGLDKYLKNKRKGLGSK